MGEPTTVAVHRCRFVDFTPSAITALAFPPFPLPLVKRKGSVSGRIPFKFGTLAIGHANGNVDLCEWTGHDRQSHSPQAWVIRKTLSGPFPSKVDSLVFAIRHPTDFSPDDVATCHDLRLFSSGGGSDLIEWDLNRGCVRRIIGSQGGSIWSIAVNPASNLLALGCEDGSVRLISLLHDTLTHHRRFDRVKCRLLSVAWGPPLPRQTSKQTECDEDSSDDGDGEDDWTDTWIVTGGSDSSLRKWDVSTGRVLDRMGTDKMRGERTLVWAVGVLGDGTIVSGDSLGMVKFWDSRTCTQLQSFQGHAADVLCLSIGPDGSTIYSSGVDQKISQFSLVKTSTPENPPPSLRRSSSRWVRLSSRRMHSHDVRALVTWPPHTVLPPSHKRQFPIDISPILVSGGFDMSVVLTPAALPSSTVVKVINPLCTSAGSTFEVSHHRRLAYACGPSSTLAVRVARQARLLTCMRDTGLSVWRIFRKQPTPDDRSVENGDQELIAEGGWKKVLDMELNVHTNLIASAISDDGRWLVVSDVYETKLFLLDSINEFGLKPRRIKEFSSMLQSHLPDSLASTGGLAFTFTPDSSKLVMSTVMSTYVLIIDLGDNNQKPTILRRFDHHLLRKVVGSRVMKTFKSGDDVEILDDEDTDMSTAVNILRLAISTDGQWLASSDDHARTHIFNLDSMQHHCTLPSFPQPAHTLSFNPSQPNILIMGFPDNTLQIFDVESRQFPAWSKHLSNLLPKEFTHAHDPILGVTFHPAIAESSSSSGPNQALIWSSTWICSIKLDDTPLVSASMKKRRRENKKHSATASSYTERTEVSLNDQCQDVKMFTHFKPILCVDFLGPGELVVVERPLVDVLANLPPAYFKHKYGAS